MSYLTQINVKNFANEQYSGSAILNPKTKDCFQHYEGAGLRIINFNTSNTTNVIFNGGVNYGGMAISPDFKYCFITPQNSAWNGGLLDISSPLLPVKKYNQSLGGNGGKPFFINNNIYGFSSVYAGGNLNSIFLFDLNANLLQSINPNSYNVANGIYNSNKNRVFFTGSSKANGHTQIIYFDVVGNSLVNQTSIDLGFAWFYPLICFSSDLNYLIFGDATGYAKYDLDLKVIDNYKTLPMLYTTNYCNSISVSNDGKYISTQNQSNASRIIKISDGSIIYNSLVPNGSLTFFPDGSFIAGDYGAPKSLYYGTYYNPASVNNDLTPSQTGGITLINMHRPVSLLGNYKS